MLAVLGGGIGGLSAAYYAVRNSNIPVTLFEASARVGGWIKSTNTSLGCVFEQGPRTLRPKGEVGMNTLSLIDDLGLSDKVLSIPQLHPAALNRMIYVNKTLHSLPAGIASVFSPQPPFTKSLISALFKDMRTPRKKAEDESIYDFVERRLGHEIAEFLISPLVCGVCAGNAKEISVKLLMRSLFKAEQEHGSIVRGMLINTLLGKKSKTVNNLSPSMEKARNEKWSVYSLKGGLETLPLTLIEKIEDYGGQVSLESPCQKLTFLDDKVLITIKDKEYEVDHVISSLPAAKLGPLLYQHPFLSQQLAAIPSVSVAVVNLHFQGDVLKRKAFGFLVPPSQKMPLLGIVFDSCCFSNGSDTVLTVMMGGYWFNEHFGQDPSPDALLDVALKNTKAILSIPQEPHSYKVSILRDCIPQYTLGHFERVEKIRTYIKEHNLRLGLCGSSYDGLGVNDVIFSSKSAVEDLSKL